MTIFARRRFGAALTLGSLCCLLGIAVPVQAVPQDDTETQPEDAVARAHGEAALAEAREHLDAGRWAQAVAAYEQALSYLPGNVEAQSSLEYAQRMLSEASTIGDVEQDLDEQRQRTRVEFNKALQEAEEQLDQGAYETARRIMVTARVRLEQRRGNLVQAEYRALANSADDLIARIDKSEEIAELERDAQIREQARKDQQTRERAEAERRQRLVNENLRRVRHLQMELKYAEALEVIDEILFLDELNPAALALRDIIQTSQLYRDYVEIQRHKELGFTRTAIDAQRAMIAPRPNLTGPGMRSTSGLVEYPEDWPQISIQRTGDAGFQDTAVDRAVWQRLNHTAIPVDFSNNSFEDVIGYALRPMTLGSGERSDLILGEIVPKSVIFQKQSVVFL